MQKYRLLNNELMAIQWTPETHGQVTNWLDDHEFGFHVHDPDGEIIYMDGDMGIDETQMGSMCIDTPDDLEIKLGWWLTWDPLTDELSCDTDLFPLGWELVTE